MLRMHRLGDRLLPQMKQSGSKVKAEMAFVPPSTLVSVAVQPGNDGALGSLSGFAFVAFKEERQWQTQAFKNYELELHKSETLPVTHPELLFFFV